MEKKIKIPWIPLIAYTALVSVLVQFLTMFVGPSTYSWVLDHSLGVNWDGCFPQGSLIAFIFLMFAVIVMPTLSKKFDSRLLTLIYVTTMIATIKGGYPGTYNTMVSMLDTRVSRPGYSQILPEWWIPPKDVVLPALLGGASVPWEAWIPTFFTWIAVPIICYLMFAAMVSIVRRQWIEVEDLPYPIARIAYEIQTYIAEPQKEDVRLRMKVALIGFIIMFLFLLPYIIIPLFPAFPDPYGFTKWHRFHFGWYDTKKFARWLYDSIHGLRRLYLNPIYIAIGYLMPLTILNTVVIAFLFRLFAPNILVTMGYPSAWHGYSIQRTWPFGLGPLTYGGMIAGMMVFWLFVNRRYLINTLRAAFGKAPPEFKEFEKEEPMSYRMAYITLIIGFIIMYAFTLILVGRPDVTLFVVGGALLWDNFLRARIYAHTGVVGGMEWSSQGIYYYAWFYVNPATNRPYDWVPEPGRNPVAARDLVWAAYLSDIGYRTPGNTYGWVPGWGAWVGDAFRLAYLTKTPAKDVFKVMTMAMIVSTILTTPLIIWGWYTWGAKALPARMEGSKLKWGLGTFMKYPMSLAPINPAIGGIWVALPWQITGFILGILITFAQARFVWFPFNVIGFFLSWDRLGAKYGVDLLFSIAWLLKFLTIKLGGTKAYERYGIPFAAGAMAGWTFHLLLHNIACTIRFFMPG